ncbi:MAG: hypothetical protein IKE76_07195 [Clostridia bacterium]|nr:hypothetical protein [Clostridia bacterium]
MTKKDFRSRRRSHFVGLDGRFLHFRRIPRSGFVTAPQRRQHHRLTPPKIAQLWAFWAES